MVASSSLCAPARPGSWTGNPMENTVEIPRFGGEDFQIMTQFEGWKIGFLRHSERFSTFNQMERHLLTDEVFILLEGSAVLYVEGASISMECCTLYNVKKGVWHHITVSQDATVLVVENSSTSRDNTEKRSVGYADK